MMHGRMHGPRGGFPGGPRKPPEHAGRTYLRLLGFARPYRLWILLILALSLFTAFVGVFPHQVIGVAINHLTGIANSRETQDHNAPPGRPDSVKPPSSQLPLTPYVNRLTRYASRKWPLLGDPEHAIFYVLGATFLILFIISHGFGIVQGITMAYVGQSLVFDMRNEVYRHLQKLSVRYFEDNPTGDTMSRVVNDVNSLQQVIVGPVVGFLTDICRLVFLLYFCVIWDWQLTLLALVVTPVLVIVTRLFGSLMRANFRLLRERVGELNALLQDNISGICIIKAFGREKHEHKRFRDKNRDNFAVQFRVARLFTLMGPSIHLIDQFGTILVLCVGGIKVLQGEIEIGVFVVFYQYLRMVYQPVTGLTRFYNHIQQALASSERVFALLDTEPEVKDFPDATTIGRIRGKVEFRKVSFSYTNGIKVLHDVTVQAQPGEMIAFVGPSGAGKSTLTSLLLRFYDPTAGKVLIDDTDIRDVTMVSLRSQMGLVQQSPFLFNDTVKANIAYGRLGALDADIVAAAKAANAQEFIEELPDKYDTLVGERGVKLSGGQRQRLSIARAVLADPRILILDEATSSVDSEMEVLIQEAIYRLAKNRTTFVIAHRLSTVQNADAIYVLDKGRIVESGTHVELAARNGLYRRLLTVQQKSSGSSPRSRPKPAVNDMIPDRNDEPEWFDE